MRSKMVEFRISGLQYARLRNWQLAVEEGIRRREIETGHTGDGRPIPDHQLSMLLNGKARIHWGYCTEPYSYEFRPLHPNALIAAIGAKYLYLYGQRTRVVVTSNVTGESIDLSEAFSAWDDPLPESPSRISLLRMMLPEPMMVLRNLRFRLLGSPKPKGPVEFGGIFAGSDLP